MFYIFVGMATRLLIGKERRSENMVFPLLGQIILVDA